MINIEFVYYADDHSYVQWSERSTVKGFVGINCHFQHTPVEAFDELTAPNQLPLKPITLAELQQVADDDGIRIHNES